MLAESNGEKSFGKSILNSLINIFDTVLSKKSCVNNRSTKISIQLAGKVTVAPLIILYYNI